MDFVAGSAGKIEAVVSVLAIFCWRAHDPPIGPRTDLIFDCKTRTRQEGSGAPVEKPRRGHCEIQKGPVEVRWAQYPADAGMYQELVSRIENGAANPELDTLGKISDALGVHPRELLEE